VYLTDKDGTIFRVSLNGDVSSVDLGKYSPKHIFMVADINKDGKPEFIFSDLNILQVFNHEKQKVFEQRLEPSATNPFLVDLADQGLGIGYCFKDSEQLVLFDPNGVMVDGFPLSGSSAFSINQTDEGLNVISVSGDKGLTIQSIH
ncbi:MAG: hypothetical protein ACI9LA_000893, partial [Bacteroidia bacterium]